MIIHGDSLQELAKIDTESVDLLCTDPPYGYSFMGKSWDKTLPDIGIFKECHRVLKPGAFAFVMSAPRSDVCARMMLMLEDAGFEIGFTPIYWTYASGFPKASNIGKMVDKRNGTERKVVKVRIDGAGNATSDNLMYDEDHKFVATKVFNETKGTSPLEGSYGGFQPKPAVEVVIVAMKPLSEKTFVDQALKNGKGITWLDDCRIPANDMEDLEVARRNFEKNQTHRHTNTGKNFLASKELKPTYGVGRFPANLLVSDDVLNDGRVIKAAPGGMTKFGGGFGNGGDVKSDAIYNDSGPYSRYFSLDAWSKTLPFLIVPKASKREKNEGLERAVERAGLAGEKSPTMHKNHHPTVKPLTLMSYLITLGSRPGDVVLDPFLGSGTTALAAKQLGRKYIGIEREKEYVVIAEARLKAVQNALL